MGKVVVICQVICLWIAFSFGDVLFVDDSGFGHNKSETDTATYSSNSASSSLLEKEQRTTVNQANSTESVTSKNLARTESVTSDDNLQEIASTFNVSVTERNETKLSPFPSDGWSTVTSELPIVHEKTTASTNSEGLEANKTWTTTRLSIAATSKSNKRWTDTELPTTATSDASKIETDRELSTTVTEGTTEEPEECKPDNCTSAGNNCTYTKHSGCIRLRESATEEAFFYTILIPNESSLISVEMEPEKRSMLPDSTINFEFEECEALQTKWEIKAGTEMKTEIYISRGPSLTLRIFTDKSWINATLRYKELKTDIKEDRAKDTMDEGVLRPPMLAGIRYRPNINITYLLIASRSRWNTSSVMMTVSFVDLDDGDYLLIGAGNETFSGPEPFYFTGRISKSRKYYIASDDVYVLFVSGSSQKVDKKGFYIKWERSGTAIIKPDQEDEEDTIPDYIIQSVGICLYNKSLLSEFNRSKDHEGLLQKFREELAREANLYAEQNNIALNPLKAAFVELFRVSSVIEPIEDVMPDGGLYVMVSIVNHYDKKTAVFRRNQLEEIIDKLDHKNGKSEYSLLGFRAGRCPSIDTYLEWYIAAVLLVVISTITLIIVWICTSVSKWRGFANSNNSSGQVETMYCKEPEIPARENDYIKYTPGITKPKVRLTTAEGDTVTLESESSNQSREEQDDGPDRVLFHQEWIMKKRPSSNEVPRRSAAAAEIETTKPFLQTFAAPIPSTRRKESDRMWIDIQMNSLLSQENTQPVDHEYDSLDFHRASASSTTCLVQHEGETKL